MPRKTMCAVSRAQDIIGKAESLEEMKDEIEAGASRAPHIWWNWNKIKGWHAFRAAVCERKTVYSSIKDAVFY